MQTRTPRLATPDPEQRALVCSADAQALAAASGLGVKTLGRISLGLPVQRASLRLACDTARTLAANVG